MNTKIALLGALLLVSMAATAADAGIPRGAASAPATISSRVDPGCCPGNGDPCDVDACCATECVTR